MIIQSAFPLVSTRWEPTALGSHYDEHNIENNYTLNSDEILSGTDSHHSMKWDHYWRLIDEATKGERLSMVTGKYIKEWPLSIQTLDLMCVWPSGWDSCGGLSLKVHLILFSVFIQLKRSSLHPGVLYIFLTPTQHQRGQRLGSR